MALSVSQARPRTLDLLLHSSPGTNGWLTRENMCVCVCFILQVCICLWCCVSACVQEAVCVCIPEAHYNSLQQHTAQLKAGNTASYLNGRPTALKLSKASQMLCQLRVTFILKDSHPTKASCLLLHYVQQQELGARYLQLSDAEFKQCEYYFFSQGARLGIDLFTEMSE